MFVDPRPFDVILIEGQDSFGDKAVMWRSLSKYAHCVFAIDNKFNVYDPNLDGLKKQTLEEYRGKIGAVLRIKDQAHLAQVKDSMAQWLEIKYAQSKGYDYLAWLGFASGLKGLQDENRWFCSELPYWCFMEHGFKLSHKELTFMYPSYFIDNAGCFDLVHEGIL